MAKRSFETGDPFSEFDRMFEEMQRRMEMLMGGLGPFGQMEDEPTFVSYRRIEGPDMEPVEELKTSGGTKRLSAPQDHDGPLIDVREKDGMVTVLAELPGISKEDISLEIVGKSLAIDVALPTREFSKEVPLPCAVKASSTKANYRNGVLEVVLEKKAPRKRKGTKVKVE